MALVNPQLRAVRPLFHRCTVEASSCYFPCLPAWPHRSVASSVVLGVRMGRGCSVDTDKQCRTR